MHRLRSILIGGCCGLALGIGALFQAPFETGEAAQMLTFCCLAGVVACLSLGSALRWEERFGRVGWYACWMLAGADGFAAAGAVVFRQEQGGWFWVLPLCGALVGACYGREGRFIVELLEGEDLSLESARRELGQSRHRQRCLPKPKSDVSEVPSPSVSDAGEQKAPPPRSGRRA